MANPKSRKRKQIVVFSAIGAILIALTVVALVRKREVVITVQTEKAARRNITELVPANGRIQPVLQVKISPEVSGEIIELPVKEGQKVKKGDLLLRIKPDFYIANRNQAEASYKASLTDKTTAEANLEKTAAEFKRNEELFSKKLISESVYSEVKTAYDIAKASLQSSTHRVEMAKAIWARADEELAKTTISSPLTGTVSRLNSELGERVVGTAQMAGTEVMTIADLNEMEARVDIGEIDVILIAPGQKARLEVDAFKQERKFTGTVTEIANSAKGSGQMGGGGQSQDATRFEVKIRIQEKEVFRPGMSVTAEIETRSRTNVVTVPIQSVTVRLPKEPAGAKGSGDKKGSAKSTDQSKPTNAIASRGTNAVASTGTNTVASAATNAVASAGTNTVASAGTNAPILSSTNNPKATESKKAKEAPKPIEVVFALNSDRVKMVPVKLGISDDSYMEIVEGLEEGAEIVSGGYKAVSRDLEDGKRIKKGKPEADREKEKK